MYSWHRSGAHETLHVVLIWTPTPPLQLPMPQTNIFIPLVQSRFFIGLTVCH